MDMRGLCVFLKRKRVFGDSISLCDIQRDVAGKGTDLKLAYDEFGMTNGPCFVSRTSSFSLCLGLRGADRRRATISAMERKDCFPKKCRADYYPINDSEVS